MKYSTKGQIGSSTFEIGKILFAIVVIVVIVFFIIRKMMEFSGQ